MNPNIHVYVRTCTNKQYIHLPIHQIYKNKSIHSFMYSSTNPSHLISTFRLAKLSTFNSQFSTLAYIVTVISLATLAVIYSHIHPSIHIYIYNSNLSLPTNNSQSISQISQISQSSIHPSIHPSIYPSYLCERSK